MTALWLVLACARAAGTAHRSAANTSAKNAAKQRAAAPRFNPPTAKPDTASQEYPARCGLRPSAVRVVVGALARATRLLVGTGHLRRPGYDCSIHVELQY